MEDLYYSDNRHEKPKYITPDIPKIPEGYMGIFMPKSLIEFEREFGSPESSIFTHVKISTLHDVIELFDENFRNGNIMAEYDVLVLVKKKEF